MGNCFFETIGISVAVGTVLGASTLPFYSQPGTQFVDLHLWHCYEAVTRLSRMFVQRHKAFFGQTDHTTLIPASESFSNLGDLTGFVYPDLTSVPLVSLTW